MATWEIIVIVAVAVLVLLAIGGYLANQAIRDRTGNRFDEHLRQVNEDLAAAHAQDRGWERESLEEAARRAYGELRPGAVPADMALVQVIDRPGTDDDKAVFRFTAAGAEEYLTLGRRQGEWVQEGLAPPRAGPATPPGAGGGARPLR